VTAIPEDSAEEILSGGCQEPPPHDPFDWLGVEAGRLADDLALTFEQSERLGASRVATLTPLGRRTDRLAWDCVDLGRRFELQGQAGGGVGDPRWIPRDGEINEDVKSL
jgi:hypothetical protein